MPFDIGFIELCTVLVVSVILLGPDKLPIAARALTRFFRAASRTVHSFKSEVDRELQMDELKRQMEDHQARLNKAIYQANDPDFAQKLAQTQTMSQEDASGTEKPATQTLNKGH